MQGCRAYAYLAPFIAPSPPTPFAPNSYPPSCQLSCSHFLSPRPLYLRNMVPIIASAYCYNEEDFPPLSNTPTPSDVRFLPASLPASLPSPALSHSRTFALLLSPSPSVPFLPSLPPFRLPPVSLPLSLFTLSQAHLEEVHRRHADHLQLHRDLGHRLVYPLVR